MLTSKIEQLSTPLPQLQPTLPEAAFETRHRPHAYRPDWMLLLVLAVAICFAASAYARFLQSHDHLWVSTIHDRNTHYSLGLSMGLDIRQGNVLQLLRDFDGSRVWGPLHGILVALTQVVAGPDYRVAVLPSLCGWVGMAVFGFLAARRMVARGGNVAGLVAALFILASPAHQAFATDVMLESMGACLTLLALYLYLVTVQERSVWAGRALGLSLTALFVYKYNYWLLVLFAVVACELSQHPRKYYQTLQSLRAGRSWATLLQNQLRRPLNYLIVALLLAMVFILNTGGTTLDLGELEVSITSHHNLLHLAYILIFARVFFWWRCEGRQLVGHWGLRTRQFVYWHLVPIAVWFLLPKRIGFFIWYLSMEQGRTGAIDFMGGVPYYANWIVVDYHIALWSCLLAVGLVGGALLAYRNLRGGAAVLLWFVLIAVLLASQHPNRMSRFLHTWVPGIWVVAGAGFAGLVYLLAREHAARWRMALASAGILGLALLHLPAATNGGHAPDGGPKLTLPTTFELTDCYLPVLEGAQRPVVMSNQPIKSLVHWTYLAQYPSQRKPETDIKYFGQKSPAENRVLFERWLNETRCDDVIYIHIPPGSHFHAFKDYPDQAALLDMLHEQKRFQLKHRWDLPKYGAVIYHWSRRSDATNLASSPGNGIEK